MKFPNVASLAILAALVAALEFFVAGAEGASNPWLTPTVILLGGALAKGLEVYLKQARDNTPRALDAPPTSSVRQWLLE